MIRLLLILIILVPVTVDAVENKTVTHITRITHPAMQANNYWQGEGYGNDFNGSGMWNKDFSRILIYENVFQEHPDYPSQVGYAIAGGTGRGFVWGYVGTLKTLGGVHVNGSGSYSYANDYDASLADYKANTYLIPEKYWRSSSWSVKGGAPVWSLTKNDVIYVIDVDNLNLVSYNLTTGNEDYIADIDCTSPCSGKTANAPAILGWTVDDTLIVGLSGVTNGDWNDGFWEINVITGARVDFFGSKPDNCTDEGDRWSWAKRIHGSRSPDTLYRATYDSWVGVARNDSSVGGCDDQPISGRHDSFGQTQFVSHCQWTWDNDYYFCSQNSFHNPTLTDPWLTNTDYLSDPRNSYALWQIHYDRITHAYTYNFLYSMPAPGLWNSGATQMNYHSLMTPTVRRDINQLMIVGTNGAYSLDDYDKVSSVTPYGARGIFLLDFTEEVSYDTTTLSIHTPNGSTVAQADDQIITYTLTDIDTTGVTVDFYYDTARDGCTASAGCTVISGSCQDQPESASLTALTGSIDVTGININVPGTNTLYLTELAVGATIHVSGETRTIAAIADNTTATVTSAWGSDLDNDITPQVNPYCIWDTGAITAGTYYIYGITSTGQGNSYSGPITISLDSDTAPEVLTIAQPADGDDVVSEGSSFDITYTFTDADPINTPLVDFYYDSNNSGSNGVAITGACADAAVGTGVTCAWDTDGMAAGNWYVYGIGCDGTACLTTYSSDVLTITGGGSPGMKAEGKFNFK